MSFIVRVDDYPFALVNDERVVYGKRMENQQKFHDFFRARGIPYILGVVPAHIMTPDLEMLKQMQGEGLSVAMHGYDHHHLGTYANLFREKTGQCIRLLFRAGLEKMDGIGNGIYISPFNEVDINLISGLFDLGFGQVYGGDMIEPDNRISPFIIHSIKGTEKSILQVCPEARFYGTSDAILKNMDEWKEDDEIHSLTLHWTWEISYLQQSYDSLGKLLDKLKGKCLKHSQI